MGCNFLVCHYIKCDLFSKVLKPEFLHIMETNHTLTLFQLLLGLCSILFHAKSDPDPLHDYCVADTTKPHNMFLNEVQCINPNNTLASHFGTSALSQPSDLNQSNFNITLTNLNNLPGLNTLGLVMARIDIAINGLVPPHSHPRASEVVILLEGSLLVGFLDSSNRLYRQLLSSGDCFVFPKGLVHFLYNVDSNKPALALSGFNSQNPGMQSSSFATFDMKSCLCMPN